MKCLIFTKKNWMCCVDIEYLLIVGSVYICKWQLIMEKQVLHVLYRSSWTVIIYLRQLGEKLHTQVFLNVYMCRKSNLPKFSVEA